jgi:tyrosinase
MSDGVIIRQNVELLTAGDLAALRDAYTKMQAIADNRGFNYLAGIHGVPQFHCPHHQILFLPWHRAYMYNFEQFVRDQNPAATIPWWDWTSDNSHQQGIPQAFSDAAGADGQPNPLLKSRMDQPHSRPPLQRDTTRSPMDPSALPATSDVQDALSRTQFQDFWMAIEDIHDQVHGWTGGDMGVIPTAAFDPIFYSHHCMIDRLWYIWQIQNGQNNIPSQLLTQQLVPFGMTVADVLDIGHLGYEYGTSVTTAPGA